MHLPTLPTDNLYKFLALSGVVTAIANAYLFVSKVYEYKDSLLQHKAELEFLHPVTLGGLVIGMIAAFAGFALWYVRLQRPTDAEVKARAELLGIQVQEARAKIEISLLQLQKEKDLLSQNISPSTASPNIAFEGDAEHPPF